VAAADPLPARLAQAVLAADATAAEAAWSEAATLATAGRRELAWALKVEAHASWSTAPARVAVCVNAVRRLHSLGADLEIGAVAHWVEGIGALARGDADAALDALRQAHGAFVVQGRAAAAAETLVPQVVALSLRGRHDEALATGERARAAFTASGDFRSAGKVELNLATLLTRLERPADAAVLYRSAAVRFARAGDVEHSVMADVGLANALTMQLDLDEALRINERARSRAERHGLPVLLAHAQAAIGRIALRRGQHAAALRALADALHRLEAAQVAPQRLLEAETALAEAYAAVQLLPEAARLYGRVAQRAQELGAPTEQAWACLQRSRALTAAGQLPAAEQALDTAAERFASLGHPAQSALVELARAGLALAHGEAEAARQAAAQAAATLGESGLPAFALEARVLEVEATLRALRPEALLLPPTEGRPGGGTSATAGGGIGNIGGTVGSPAGAAPALQGLVEHLRVLSLAVARMPALRQRCELALAELAVESGRLEDARDHLSACLDLLDGERSGLPGDEYRVALAARGEVAHRRLVALDAARAEPAQFWVTLERGRGRGAPRREPAEGASGGDVRAALELLQWHRERWQTALREAAPRERRVPLQQALREAEERLQEAVRRQGLQRAGADRPASASTPWPADAASSRAWAARLQARLGVGRALVQYHLDGGALQAVVATPERVQRVELPGGDLREALAALRFQLDTPRYAPAGFEAAHGDRLMERMRVRSREVHQRLWQPLEGALADCRDVVVVPHGELHEVPFAALHDGTHWLVQTHRIVHASGARAWAEATELGPRPQRGHVLALAGDDTGLPNLRSEVEAIARAHGGRARCLVGVSATAAALRSAAAGADVLHLACHAQFRADNPAFSALHLADGPLTLHELAQWRLDAALAILSACETGRGRIAPGDEVLGLVRAFRHAGVQEVVSTLWPVQDASSAALMTAFHAALSRGQPAADALRLAQLEAIEQRRHPFHWAAFVLHGR
jgi:tetratricopeptide (TPR) repeat protein